MRDNVDWKKDVCYFLKHREDQKRFVTNQVHLFYYIDDRESWIVPINPLFDFDDD